MKKKQIAFQGERGAYSHEAIVSFFKGPFEVRPLKGLSDVFRAVEEKEVDCAVIPIENSLEGSVNESYDLLLSSRAKVRGEINLRIVHCLIANPEARLDRIKVAYSHPQALAQCRGNLKKLGLEALATYDTAGSVDMIKKRGGPLDAAAVASEEAARMYGMKVLAKGIEDNPNNYTRFFTLALKDSPPTGKDKTSIIFSTEHKSGALYRAMEVFAVRGINLTRIESRPTRQTPWEYNFYLDFEGHRKDEKCAEALEALKERSNFCRVLGSYPKARGADPTVK